MAKNYTKRTPEQIRTHLRDFAASRLTRKGFCEAHGIKYPTFCRWLKKVDGVRQRTSENTSAFLKLEPSDAPDFDRDERLFLRLRLAGGAELDFFQEPDTEFIKSLINNR